MLHSNANVLEMIGERQQYKSPTCRLEMSGVWIMTTLSSIKDYFLKADDTWNLFSKQTWRILLGELILEIDKEEKILMACKSEVAVPNSTYPTTRNQSKVKWSLGAIFSSVQVGVIISLFPHHYKRWLSHHLPFNSCSSCQGIQR